SSLIDVTALAGTGGPLATLVPKALTLSGSAYSRICVDQTYAPPPGVHLSLWRYVAIGSGTCTAGGMGSPTILGFGAERPDRVRYEFSAAGQLLDLLDANGVDLRYAYALAPAAGAGNLGALRTVYEPRSCSDPSVGTCRKFSFAYSADLPTTTCPASTDPARTCVKDPAGRV